MTSLSDPGARRIRWNLTYQGLTDKEAEAIIAFYELCEGNLQPFLFLDPTGNLLAHSEDFRQTAWVKSTRLSISDNIADPFGGSRATRLQNGSAATLGIAQTAGVPGAIQCTFSAYVKSVSGLEDFNVQMTRTDGSTVETYKPSVEASWLRASLSSAFASSISDTCDFSISIDPGSSLDIFGIQLETQPFAGKYVTTTSDVGIYSACRFDSSDLRVVSTGPGESSIGFSVIAKAN